MNLVIGSEDSTQQVGKILEVPRALLQALESHPVYL
jgi:hypothetical protein